MKKIERPLDKTFHLIIKWLMTAIFAWSGVIWSGMTVLQFSINSPEHSNLAWGFLAGSLILLLCLILCWVRLYILQIVPCVVGLIVYLDPAKEMIDHAEQTGVLFKPTFEQRYLPMLAFAILALALFVARILRIAADRAQREEEYNNRPSESILDKHKDN